MDQDLASSNTLQPPFLRLPPPIREEVYRLPYYCLDQWPASFRGLLLTCRLVYAEVATLLYSANLFVLHFADARSFTPLYALSPLALSSLTALRVVLNQASCHQRLLKATDFDDCCGAFCEEKLHYGSHYRRHQRPFLTVARGSENGEEDEDDAKEDPETEARIVPEKWRAAVQHIAPHITPARLKLSFVCDINPKHTDAVDLANLLLTSLSVLPVLKGCEIRLSKEPDAGLSRMAHDTSLQLCGIRRPYLTPPAGKITFVTLPRELRLRVLEYTDLVTPSKEVWWSRKDHQYSWGTLYSQKKCYTADGRCLYYPQCPDLGRCTFRTTSDQDIPSGSPAGCFCARRHGAYSSRCVCWAEPRPALFLVCRTLCRDAQLVFYSGNRFVIHDLSPSCEAEYSHRNPPRARFGENRNVPVNVTYPYDRFGVSIFFRDIIPSHCIAYLRSLEISFPLRLERSWPTPDSPAMQDWCETVDWLRGKINGPGLTLGFVDAEYSDYYYGSDDHDIITEEEADMMHKSILAILTPLNQLAKGPNALNRFYTDVVYPWEWTARSYRRWLDHREWGGNPRELRRAFRTRHNRTLETLVMGDQYHTMFADGNRATPYPSVFKQVQFCV
ncbi:uncharacterized protein C8A04DRAFT_38278 [Dichotomopilus funicola]|uniref:Uncharacterized protein n=1 Tax=Dichotomopilus funicola TaxID=1934379 RepID=A0AAN6V0J4_9PEZI|nr:hypothetical protein C8A04DRAFT_38278 [Dichotomopilus funicola]